MVGIVIVSHSRRLAEGVIELARQMAGGDVALAAAAGIDDPDNPIGTDATKVAAAIGQVDSGEGVLVLMDLGSAVLSAEMARDLLPPDVAERVLLCEAPLVEGAMAAVVQARLGASLQEVAAEARRGLFAKSQHLGGEAAPSVEEAQGEAIRLTVSNRLGLHARPAARFVQAVAGHDARVTVVNLTTGAGPVSGTSLTALTGLGVRRGHEIEIRAEGPDATRVLERLRALVADGFGDREPEQPTRGTPAPTESGRTLTGVGASPGVAAGPVRHLALPRIDVPDTPVDDPQAAWDELERALQATRRAIEETRRSVQARAGSGEGEIFDAHLVLLDDENLLDTARRLIFEARRHPASAWLEAGRQAADGLRRLGDPYLAERAVDIESVAIQVVGHLLGVEALSGVESPGVVVASDLAPIDTGRFDRDRVWGIATAGGGPTSHSAILARALGIPAVVGLGPGILELAEDTMVVVDGDRGVVHVDPAPQILERVAERQKEDHARRSEALGRGKFPAFTVDGTRIEVAANLATAGEAPTCIEAGADGVGLLRTEFLFLDRDRPPSEDEQYQTYLRVAQVLDGRPLILRTLDIGGDKPVPFVARPPEANPFLGVRGLRLGLAQTELLRTQLCAALRVAEHHPLKIMFPMVATVDEFVRARRMAVEAARRVGVDLDQVEIGVMVEVPSAALIASHLAACAEFFSIGTNDLTQYVLAAERGNPGVAHLADPLHPAVLKLIAATCRAAGDKGRWVGVCGEMAADQAAIPVLLGLGVRELSMAAPAIPVAKDRVRSIHLEKAADLARRALEAPSAEAVRELVEGFGDV